MKDYRLKSVRESIKQKFPSQIPLEICIVTYNRLFYLQKCVWSIIAATVIPSKIYIIDDNSTDGETRDWLMMMHKRGLIEAPILNKKRIGTANNFNKVIDSTKGEFIVMLNDDMYFHRYWDVAIMDMINEYPDAGIVSFYNYTRLSIDKENIILSDYVMKVVRTGLGACILNRSLYEDIGKFRLPENKLMGIFTTRFCLKAMKSGIKRRVVYQTIPHYATNMDLPRTKLQEDKLMENEGYRTMRRKWKGRAKA